MIFSFVVSFYWSIVVVHRVGATKIKTSDRLFLSFLLSLSLSMFILHRFRWTIVQFSRWSLTIIWTNGFRLETLLCQRLWASVRIDNSIILMWIYGFSPIFCLQSFWCSFIGRFFIFVWNRNKNGMVLGIEPHMQCFEHHQCRIDVTCRHTSRQQTTFLPSINLGVHRS